MMLTEILLGYIGPGPGLSMIGALLGLAVTLGFALWAILLWPYRVLMRKLRERREVSSSSAAP